MKRLQQSLAFCLVLLAACTTAPEPQPPVGNWIKLETRPGPHCGRCDSTKLVVQANGLVHIEQGHWLFSYRFWQTSRRHEKLPTEAASAFRSHLERFRPQGTLNLSFSEECDTYRTDQAGAHIRWRETPTEDELFADFGCQSQRYPVTRCALIEAVETLGIAKLRMREWEWANCD